MNTAAAALRLAALAASVVATLAIVTAIDAHAERHYANARLQANVVRLEPVTITAQRPVKQAAKEAAARPL